MTILKGIENQLKSDFPDYTFELNTKLGRDAIIVAKDKNHGAVMYELNNKIQIIAMAPSKLGRLKASVSKTYDQVAEQLMEYLIQSDSSIEVEMVPDAQHLDKSEKQKKNDNYGSIIFGLGLIGLSAYLFNMFNNLEQMGGEMDINWIIALLYNNLGKEITCSILALAGIVMSIIAFRKLRKT